MKKIVLFAVFAVLCGVFALSPVEASAAARQKTVLMVLTGTGIIPGTYKQTGFWAEEFVVPLKLFRQAGHKVIVTSLAGGRMPVDPGSIDPKIVGEDHAREWRRELDKARSALNTVPLSRVKLEKVDAVFVVGGHGVMWDLTDSAEMQAALRTLFLSGKIVSAVCHGPGAFVRVTLPDGRFMLDGKRVAGFSAIEEEQVGMTKIVPYCLEEELKKASGSRYECGEPWKSFVITDDRIVTGQNPASSADTAKAVIDLLKVAAKR